MPIKFRCEQCHHLLGIGRRKSMSWVICPICEHLVKVPLPYSTISDKSPPDPPHASASARNRSEGAALVALGPRTAGTARRGRARASVIPAEQSVSSWLSFDEDEAIESAPVGRKRGSRDPGVALP